MGEGDIRKEQCVSQGIEGVSFEAALAELERITNLLERGDVKLDDAVKYYERACVLHKHCKEKLDNAQMKVEKLLHKDGVAYGSEAVNLSDDC